MAKITVPAISNISRIPIIATVTLLIYQGWKYTTLFDYYVYSEYMFTGIIERTTTVSGTSVS
ncbi:MAG: hypothetical protein ABEI86_05805, partial [Halobacteriaceae archaeon]